MITLIHTILLWTSDQPDADLYLTTHNTHKRQTSKLLVEFEPTIPASKWLETHALDCATRTVHNLPLNYTTTETKLLFTCITYHRASVQGTAAGLTMR